MSRSIGGSSLMILSSIKIRPEVIDSRPATILNVVVLPQPEGPTRTTNSLSRIARFTSLTAWTWSNILFRFWMATLAIAFALPSGDASSFDRPGQAGDVMFDKERINKRDRNRAQQRT